MARGKFIVIDGMDGAGKGMQLHLLEEKLKDKGVLFTREPGGSPKAEEIRRIILQTGGPNSNPVCDFFLFWAARGSHVQDVVIPNRDAGKHVICDRYDASTFAFQIHGERSARWLESLFTQVRSALPEGYLPDLYIFLDLPPEVAYERRQTNPDQERSKFDLKPVEYYARVREGFKKFGEQFEPVRFVDANRTPEKVHTDVWGIITAMI
jgi:dTMP kinase